MWKPLRPLLTLHVLAAAVIVAAACGDDESADPGVTLDGSVDGQPSDGPSPSNDGASEACNTCGEATCVDFQTDSKHCGSCGTVCQEGACAKGTCQPVVILGNLDGPQNVTTAFDAIYATIPGENRVVRVELDGGAASNITGSTTLPWGISAGPQGFNGLVAYAEARDGGNASAGTVLCTTGSCSNLAPFSTSEGLVRHIAFDGTRDVYWAVEGTGTIRHKDPLVGPVADLITGETAIYGIAISQPTVYFTRREAAGKLRRVDTNATGLADLATNLSFPEGVVTDYLIPNTLWIADTGNDRIATCPGTGCGLAATTFAPAKQPHEIALDVQNVYWTNGGANGSVQYCPKTGCPAAGPTTLASGQANPSGIVVASGHVYWANASSPGAIMRIRKP